MIWAAVPKSRLPRRLLAAAPVSGSVVAGPTVDMQPADLSETAASAAWGRGSLFLFFFCERRPVGIGALRVMGNMALDVF